MNRPSAAEEALYRLLAGAWDPLAPPAAEAIPWPELLRLTGPGNIAPTVYAVAQQMAHAMPADVREALEQAFYRAAADNTRCLEQVARAGQALVRAGAPLLLLKGAALAETLYGERSLRAIGDIDLAVPAGAVPACRAALMALGYVPRRAEHRPGSLLAHNNQEQFTAPAPFHAPLELHWHILDVPYYMRRVPMQWFWEHSEPRTIAGQPFQVLVPEANLVYLPAHLALHHQFQGLHSLLDLALLIVREGDRLDWPRILATAQRFELLCPLRESLERLARCWPGLPLDEPRRQAKALEPSRMDERLYRLLSAQSRSTTLDFYTTLVSLPDFASRARYAWFNLFPQPAYMKQRYPVRAGWHLPYWYLRRLAEGLPRLARALRHARRLERGGE